MAGLAGLVFTGVLFAPWIAVGAMLKQRDAFAREQALAFELERSEFERKALRGRVMRLATARYHLLCADANRLTNPTSSRNPRTSALPQTRSCHLGEKIRMKS